MPSPKPCARTVEVAVVAGALNYSDLNVVYAGLLGLRGRKYEIFGSEIAGVVTARAEGCEAFDVGDRVVTQLVPSCGQCYGCRHRNLRACERKIGRPQAAFQDKIWIPVSHLQHIPRRMPMRDAVAISFSATVAADIVRQVICKASPNKYCLVTAANGALGAYITQMASRREMSVMNIVRSSGLEQQCRANGAQAFVAFDSGTTVPVLEREAKRFTKGRGFDAIIDLAADIYASRCLQLLRPGGHYWLVGAAGTQAVEQTPMKWRWITENEVHMCGYNFREAAGEDCKPENVLETNSVLPLIDSVFPKERIDEACARAWWSTNKYGKVIVTFGHDSVVS